ncbi:LysR substrate-binding domain-containing protein [Salinisphaera shabanensis]|nr:LysR substrate-binding domain-containing protein [Salinisphaera shabanensis]
MSLRGFEQTVESVRGIGGGTLRLATIDNVIADCHCPLVAALRDFMQPQTGRDIDYSLTVLTPEAMERQLFDKRIDLALGVFESPHELLEYTPLYDETDHLYAAAAHPASDAGHDTATLAAVLSASRFASRSFLDDAERALLGLGKLARVSHASNLEALLALILTGQYVGSCRHITPGRGSKQARCSVSIPHAIRAGPRSRWRFIAIAHHVRS